MYKQLLIATTNQNKVSRIKALFPHFPLPIISLSDLDVEIPEPEETALSCVGIAMQKAVAYLDYVEDGTIVLTQDDTIVFSGVEPADNPGPAIKLPVKMQYGEFSDKLAVEYYTTLAKKYGGSIPMTFHYGHAIAVSTKGKRPSSKVFAAESMLISRLVDSAHKLETVPGYFLAAVMQVKINNQWLNYTDLDSKDLIKLDEDLKSSIDSLLQCINQPMTKDQV